MKCQEVLNQLEEMGNEGTKKIFMKHGASEPIFGVKVGDLKKIQKKIKKDHELSLELFDTGNSDARYLAGLIADETKITKKQLEKWAKDSDWYMLSEYTVAWIAADSPHGWDLGLKWIKSKEEKIASSGWATLSNHISITPDEDLDIQSISNLLDSIPKNIQAAPNRVRYTMNGFVIAVGSYVSELTEKAIEIGKSIGKVDVKMGGTACKVPDAPSYILKIQDKGRIGKKRKMARC